MVATRRRDGRPGRFGTLLPLQRTLLRQAIERTRPGGAIVYSTCSIEPEENGELVRAAIGGAATIEAEESSQPGLPGDGGYWARLRKT